MNSQLGRVPEFNIEVNRLTKSTYISMCFELNIISGTFEMKDICEGGKNQWAFSFSLLNIIMLLKKRTKVSSYNEQT